MIDDTTLPALLYTALIQQNIKIVKFMKNFVPLIKEQCGIVHHYCLCSILC